MQTHFTASAPADTDVVRFVSREDAASLPFPAAEFGGREKAVVFRHDGRQLLVGVGKSAELNPAAVRTAAGVAARWLRQNGRPAAAFDLGSLPDADRAEEFTRAAVEGALAGAYRFDRFQVTAPDEPAPVKLATLSFVTPSESARAAGPRAVAAAEAANFARELGNSPPNTFFPETLAAAAQRLAAESSGTLTAEVWEPDRLRAEGFGGLLAVGGGSAHGPRLVVVRYQGGPGDDEAPLVFVGKAVTFDSGGLSIKPAAGMEEMVWDKCGGCAALAAMQAVAALKPARNVVAVIASAENLTGSGAYRPGDVVTVFDGRHVEINNTDAEGRVILADALGYARRVLRAGRIVDLATLTGGCVVALGNDTAGLWGNDEPWKTAVLAAAGRAGEALWPMPITREHERKVKSDLALIKNSCGRAGSPCTAAAFLRTFVGDTPWAHIDLAGPAALTEDRAELARGATGFGVRTLVELACG